MARLSGPAYTDTQRDGGVKRSGQDWRPLIKIASLTMLGVAWLVLAVQVAGGWYFASILEDRALSAEARRRALLPTYEVQVLTVTDDRVTLKKSGDERLERVGIYGLAWPGGWGTAGVIVWAASGSVSSNEVIGLRRTDLQD